MDLKQKLADLPKEAGVYIMYDDGGNVLYVGKAKNLRKRVRQYFFQSGNKTEKVMLMVSHIADFRYIITPSETDAFALENTLIKKYKPPYNILLKDDKQYPYIKINVRSDFPKFEIVRKIRKDRARYFGPIMGNSKELLHLLRDIYPTVSCNLNFSKLPKNVRPCLNYHLGKCPAPCVGKITKEAYRPRITQAISFLNGEDAEVYRDLTERMYAASDAEEYEKALLLKQQINLIHRLRETKVVNLNKLVDLDVFGIVSNGNNAVVNVQLIRKGRVVVSENHAVTDAGLDEEQTLTSFLNQYYAEDSLPAPEILTNLPLESADSFAEFLKEKVSRSVAVRCPQKGVKRKLTEMSEKNAKDYLIKSEDKLIREQNLTVGAVEQLKEILQLKKLPLRVECFDISNISGVDKVASMVVFENGKKATSQYRRFKIRTVEGANDFECMKEVLTRRFLKWEDASFGAKPDLIVVDGGLGQLKYAVEAREATHTDVPLISLAEREELIYTTQSNQPIRLPKTSFALNMLINLRDEAHRFAITYFRNLHSKNALKSELENIPGIGEKRLKLLRKKFGTMENIEKATVQELTEAKLPVAVAESIYRMYHTEEQGESKDEI